MSCIDNPELVNGTQDLKISRSSDRSDDGES